jgi:Glycerophosphoryl diester phosphodiesterase
MMASTNHVQPIAHRGCPHQYPENTLRALQNAGSSAGAVEFDVRRCGTGESVVIHDKRLDRVTDVDGLVSDTSVSELQQVHVAGSTAHVPTLQEVFQTVSTDVTLHIELKEPSVIDDVVMYINQFDHDVIVSSFAPTALTAAVSAGLTDVALLFATDPQDALMRAIEIGCTAVHPSASLCIETDIVSAAHEQGLYVNAWTVEDAETLTALARISGDDHSTAVDGVIIDDCSLIERCQMLG